MQDYEQAAHYASESLAIHSHLLDYNTLDLEDGNPFELFHEEVVYHSVLISYGIIRRAFVVPDLYDSYAEGDLRKIAYFEEEDGAAAFTGSYSGPGSSLFGGLATDEIYLVRAESRARLGDTGGAMADLNTLLEARLESGNFVPFTAASADEALNIILEERRKELLFRGLRWTDLRRLNQEPEHAKTLYRTVDGVEYSLPPNDPRFVYPIPVQEMEISGIEQNPR